MLPPLLLTVTLLLLPGTAPDKFWLDSAAGANAEGSRPAVVEGVLLGEDATSYHVRVAGGEIWLPKSQVVKVEKDGLTVEALEQQEKAHKEEAQKEGTQKAEAAPVAEAAPAPADKAAGAVEAADAAASKPVEPEAAPAEEIPARYDAIRGRFVPGSAPTQTDYLRELEAAYAASGNRAVLRELRRARRAR